MSEHKIYSCDKLHSLQEKLHTAQICDILDNMGYRNQSFSESILPLKEEYRLFGHVKTMLCYNVYEMPKKPYDTEISAIDSIKNGDVVLVCSNGPMNNGFWGELLTIAAIARGARGAIIDGAVRDIAQIKQLDSQFKLFAKGKNPLDSKGRCLVADYDCVIKCGGVQIHPNDYVFADIDGIVIIPEEVIDITIEKALEKLSKENIVKKELKEGKLLRDVFKKYQIL